MWAARSAPESLDFVGLSNLSESTISMIKVSKAPSVAVQERLKLSGVMSETFKFPISGSPAGGKKRNKREETNKFELILWLCLKAEVVNRTVAGWKDLTVRGYCKMKQCYPSVATGEEKGVC